MCNKRVKYPSHKAQKPKSTLVNLILKNEDEEPDLDRAYLAELMLERGDMVNYFPDQLCCTADAIEIDDDDYVVDEDEVFYAPEIMESDAQAAYEDDQQYTSASYMQYDDDNRQSISKTQNRNQDYLPSRTNYGQSQSTSVKYSTRSTPLTSTLASLSPTNTVSSNST